MDDDYGPDIQNRLSTIPEWRRKQFERIVKKDLHRALHEECEEIETPRTKEEIIQETRELIVHFMKKRDTKKHGSKGIKHKERGVPYLKNIENKIGKYGINIPLAFKELFNVDLIEQNTRYVWLCPRHSENTPSLSISMEKWVIKCFGCWFWRITIRYFREALGLTYAETLTRLEKYIFSPEDAKTFSDYRQKKLKKVYDYQHTTLDKMFKIDFTMTHYRDVLNPNLKELRKIPNQDKQEISEQEIKKQDNENPENLDWDDIPF